MRPGAAAGGIVCYCSTNEVLFQIAGELLQQPMNGLRYGTVLTSTLYLESRVVGSIRATR